MLLTVIEIGSTGVRLSAAEDNDGALTIIDQSDNNLSLGQDVFATGSISATSQALLIEILLRYREQLAGYGVAAADTTVIATSAFRESHNKDALLDKIFNATGFRVSVLDGAEENRLMYIAMTNSIMETTDECCKKLQSGSTVILEVGGGSTGIMLIKKGKMESAHSFKLGSVRLQTKLLSNYETPGCYKSFIDEYAFDTKSALTSVWEENSVDNFIAVGNEATVAARAIGRKLQSSNKSLGPLWVIKREDFDKFTQECANYTNSECVAKFGESVGDAITLQNSLQIYRTFMHLTKVESLIVGETNIRCGVLLSKTLKTSDDLKAQFDEQTISQSVSLLQKYHGDVKHAQKVRAYCNKLFESLIERGNTAESLQDYQRAKLLLEVAAILHDIGIFINMENHNLHSQYILQNSEIFGITPNEKMILSTVVKYHRGKPWPQDTQQFQILARHDRLLILQLTAILRVSDALDRCHGKNFNDFTIEKTASTLVIHPKAVRAITLETEALAKKGDLFESVFGLHLSLL